MTARASGAAGFTLVELLVAVTLFALLSVVLFGGLRFGMRATEAGTARLDWSAEIAAASGFLRNQLADAQPLEKDAGDDRKVVAFDGEADSVEFVASPPAYLAAGGWHVLRLALERGSGGDRLVLSWRLVRADPDATTASAPQRSVLLERVTSIEFAYFGALALGDTPEWHDRWQDAAGLPALVRLRLGFADGRQAPELLVALRAAAPLWSSR
ncbi:MAG: type II secretion system protein GspJ [Stellaceae bacterium]